MEEDGSTLLQRSCLDPCHVDSYAEKTDRIAILVIVLLMPRHNFNLTCIRIIDVKGALLLLKQKIFFLKVYLFFPAAFLLDKNCPQTSLESPFYQKKTEKSMIKRSLKILGNIILLMFCKFIYSWKNWYFKHINCFNTCILTQKEVKINYCLFVVENPRLSDFNGQFSSRNSWTTGRSYWGMKGFGIASMPSCGEIRTTEVPRQTTSPKE